MFVVVLKKYSPSRSVEELIHESFVPFIGVPSLCILAMRCQFLVSDYMAVMAQTPKVPNVEHQLFHLPHASCCLAWCDMMYLPCWCVDATLQAVLA